MENKIKTATTSVAKQRPTIDATATLHANPIVAIAIVTGAFVFIYSVKHFVDKLTATDKKGGKQ